MGYEYDCLSCGHGFSWYPSDGPAPACPRCGSNQLTHNPWLLSGPDAEGLSDEDHFLAGLAV